MQRIAFTLKTVRSVPVPAKGRAYYHDEKTPHLALCVTAAGTRTYYRTGRIDGKPVRYRLGTIDELTIDAARKACAEVTLKAAAGQNPQAVKRRKEYTLGELWAWYLPNHSKAHKTTWVADERRWGRVWSDWSRRPLAAITTADVQAKVTQVRRDAGAYAGNKARELLRHMFATAIRLGWAQANPVTAVPRFRTTSRERYVQPAEMERFFAALEDSPRHVQHFVLLCLFTGARRGNVAAMRWEHVDMESGFWSVPGDDSKNRQPLNIALPSAAVQILRIRKVNAKGAWVFPGRSKRGHYAEPKAAWETLLIRAGFADAVFDESTGKRIGATNRTLRLHDLRRTLGSWMANAGMSLNLIADALTHKSLASTSIYARLQRETVQDAVDAVTAKMLEAAYPVKNPDALKKSRKLH